MKELRIVCSDPPDHINPEFIEVEDENGKSVDAGLWGMRKDGLWELVIDVSTIC